MRNYSYVTTIDQLQGCYNYFKGRGGFGFDIETSSLNPRQGKVLALQFGNDAKQYVVHAGSFTKEDLGDMFKLLADPEKLKVGHNLKFDSKWIWHHYGARLVNIHDTYITEALLNKGKNYIKLALPNVVQLYCHDAPEMDKSVRMEFANQSQKKHLTEDQILYSAMDVEFLPAICLAQRSIAHQLKMHEVMQLENDTVIPTMMMEYNGVYIDTKKWLALESIAIKERAKAKVDLDSYFADYKPPSKKRQLGLNLDGDGGGKINYNSHVQLRPALTYVLGYAIPSTGEGELLKHDRPVIQSLLTYREHGKSVSTYGSKFVKDNVDRDTGRIYTTMDQVGTDTGRYASRKPNLQNIKKEQAYRTPFCTHDPENRSFISADYSGCELRLIAELSGEPEWLDCFRKGYDMHSYVASILFNLDYHEITTNDKILPEFKDFRSKAKNINFGE